MFKRVLISFLVAIVVAIVCLILGGLFILFKVELATSVGNFLKEFSTLIGIVAGICWFIWGNYPPRV